VSRELTRAILLDQFNLTIELPPGHLCPPIPNRLQYVHILHYIITLLPTHHKNTTATTATPTNDMMSSTISSAVDITTNSILHSDKRIRVLDIGTGTSCIYPLLGYKQYGWSFVGTDIDPAAAECAARNVSMNSLHESIQVLLVSSSQELQECLCARVFASLAVNDEELAVNDEDNNDAINDANEGGDGDEVSGVESADRSPLEQAEAVQPKAVDIRELLSDIKKLSLKGPIREALSAMGADSRKEDIEEVLTACVCNPPFYSPSEEVSYIYISFIIQ
jgi:hypothetical protein